MSIQLWTKILPARGLAQAATLFLEQRRRQGELLEALASCCKENDSLPSAVPRS